MICKPRLFLIYSAAFLLFFVGCRDKTPVYPDDDSLADYQWYRVLPGGETASADGSPFWFYVKEGSSDHLLIHFMGGGACWDYDTASRPFSMKSVFSRDLKEYYIEKLLSFWPSFLAGYLINSFGDNPLQDWTIVYIPYVSGDLFSGDVVRTYTDGKKSVTVYHRGAVNALAALDWAAAYYPDANKILVAGESAGGFGSLLWLPEIRRMFPQADLFHLADCSFSISARWPELLKDVWNEDGQFRRRFEVDIKRNFIEELYLDYFSREEMSGVTYLFYGSAYDAILPQFQAKLNGDVYNLDFILNWSDSYRTTLERLSQAGGDSITFFFTDYDLDEKTMRTPHTCTSGDSFYQVEEDGVLFADWFARILDSNGSVSAEDITPK